MVIVYAPYVQVTFGAATSVKACGVAGSCACELWPVGAGLMNE